MKALTKNFLLSFVNDIKYGLINLQRYCKLVWNMRPWSTVDVFKTLKFQLSELLTNTWHYRSSEEQDNILRCIEILNHKVEDDYISRCGGVDPQPLLVSTHNNGVMYIADARATQQIIYDTQLTLEANELEKREWTEFTHLMSTFK